MQTTFDVLAGYGSPQMSNEASWAAVRGGVGENLASYAVFANKVGVGNFSGVRTLLWFDTSALTPNAYITAAKIVHPAIANNNNNDGISIYFVTHAAPSTTIVAGDFDSGIGTISFGSIAMSSLSTSVTTDIPLNASGIAAINKTGNTPIALLSSHDFNNVEPIGSANEYTTQYANFDLVVTYTLQGGGAFLGY